LNGNRRTGAGSARLAAAPGQIPRPRAAVGPVLAPAESRRSAEPERRLMNQLIYRQSGRALDLARRVGRQRRLAGPAGLARELVPV
jgi:hypothetical protein